MEAPQDSCLRCGKPAVMFGVHASHRCGALVRDIPLPYCSRECMTYTCRLWRSSTSVAEMRSQKRRQRKHMQSICLRLIGPKMFATEKTRNQGHEDESPPDEDQGDEEGGGGGGGGEEESSNDLIEISSASSEGEESAPGGGGKKRRKREEINLGLPSHLGEPRPRPRPPTYSETRSRGGGGTASKRAADVDSDDDDAASVATSEGGGRRRGRPRKYYYGDGLDTVLPSAGPPPRRRSGSSTGPPPLPPLSSVAPTSSPPPPLSSSFVERFSLPPSKKPAAAAAGKPPPQKKDERPGPFDECDREYEPVSPDRFASQITGMHRERELMVMRVAQPIEFPRIHAQVGRKPENVLLYGPGGTGKTSLVALIAKHLRIPFFYTPASQIVSGFVGRSNICFGKLIATVRRYALANPLRPGALLFLDEAETLLGDTKLDDAGAVENITSEFKNLVQDRPEDALIVMAATNYPGRIKDSGVLRRFGLKLYVGMPNAQERIELILSSIRNLYRNDRICREAMGDQALHQHGYRSVEQLEEAVRGRLRAQLELHSTGYTPAEIVRIVAFAGAQGNVQLDNLRKLVFLRSPHNPNVYYPVERNLAPANLASPAIKTPLEIELDNNMICWPVMAPETLLEAFMGRAGVTRSVGLDALDQFETYAERVLIDHDGARRIRATREEILAYSRIMAFQSRGGGGGGSGSGASAAM